MTEPLQIDDDVLIPASDLAIEYSRASGPGGQHVNTADTRVRLRFALDACEVLAADVKQRVRELKPGQVTSDGELLLTCDTHRSRHRNLQAVRGRLAAVILEALEPPRPRRPTRPSRAAKKRRRSQLKQGRQKVRATED